MSDLTGGVESPGLVWGLLWLKEANIKYYRGPWGVYVWVCGAVFDPTQSEHDLPPAVFRRLPGYRPDYDRVAYPDSESALRAAAEAAWAAKGAGEL